MTTENIKSETFKELNLEEKVTVKNIAGWTVGFKRIESQGDVTIPKEGTVRLTRSEIIAQTQSGNRLFNGTDDRGSHATLYIDGFLLSLLHCHHLSDSMAASPAWYAGQSGTNPIILKNNTSLFLQWIYPYMDCQKLSLHPSLP